MHDSDYSYDNARLEFGLVPGNVNTTWFQINVNTGDLFLISELNFMSNISVVVTVSDRGNPPLSSSANLAITISRTNCRAPAFDKMPISATVSENSANGTRVATVTAIGLQSSRLQYSIKSGNGYNLFKMDRGSGSLVLQTPQPTVERRANYRLVIEAVDFSYLAPCSAAFTDVFVNVTLINLYKPTFPTSKYVQSLSANQKNGTFIFIAQATDKDPGYYGMLKYTLSADSPPITRFFSIDQSSGEVTTAAALSYISGQPNSYSFRITAQDNGGLQATVDVAVNVEPEPLQPTFVKRNYSFQVPVDAKVGDVVGSVQAVDLNGLPLSGVIYYLRPQNDYFLVNHTNGDIILARLLQDPVGGSNRRKRSRFVSKTRSKRSPVVNDTIQLHIIAQSGFRDTKEAEVVVAINVNKTCVQCVTQQTQEQNTGDTGNGLSRTSLIILIVFVAFGFVLIIVLIAVVIRCRYKRKKPKPANTSDPNRQFEVPSTPFEKSSSLHYPTTYHNQSYTTPTSEPPQSRSTSSGRGSVEKGEEVDEEIQMINSFPGLITMRTPRIPDSGIPDDETLSNASVHNHRDYLARLGIDASAIDTKLQVGHQPTTNYSPRHNVPPVPQVNSRRGQMVLTAEPKLDDNDGIAHGFGHSDMGAINPSALFSIVNTEEVFSGSYNWDYLLNWGPQYLPLADIFSEIAQLKDDSFRPKTKPTQIIPQKPASRDGSNNRTPRTIPPPIITDAPPRISLSTHPVISRLSQSPERAYVPSSNHSRSPSNHSLASSQHSRAPSSQSSHQPYMHNVNNPKMTGQHDVRIPRMGINVPRVGNTQPKGAVPPKSPISCDNNFSQAISPHFVQTVSPLGDCSPPIDYRSPADQAASSPAHQTEQSVTLPQVSRPQFTVALVSSTSELEIQI